MKADQVPALVSQPEKPQHYSYLKEFRTQQCPLFLQHKCTQHRPYTCFHWHFANQRRRRPLRKRDGTFNYTPDSYCSKYDETTGACPSGDDCPLLHRNSGDTERRYHIRYYKTAICVHETDSKGVCTKNGVHCAFAHGTQDLRNPTYDIREVQAMERGESPTDGTAGVEMSTSMEKEKILNDDPKWNDSQYVLANYKTEPCKRPPRLCRQGYACPQYHNNKDRRRNPKVYKYRSTPCPQVKQHDEWGDPAVCENGDQCQYCHTRTEQQFYPEIYKSTKCKDMVQTGYCPRGPFCAFAHVDQEINMNKEAQMESPRPTSSLALFIPSTLQESPDSSNSARSNKSSAIDHLNADSNTADCKFEKFHNDQQQPPMRSVAANGSKEPMLSPRAIQPPNRSLSSSFSEALGHSSQGSLPGPIGKERSMSMEYQRSNSVSSRSSNSPFISSSIGSEHTISRRTRPRSGDSDGLPAGLLDSGIGGFSAPNAISSNSHVNPMSPYANRFYGAGDNVESVVGNAIDDLNMGDFQYLSFVDDPADQDKGDTASVCSSLSAGLASSYMSNSFSLPMSIPDGRLHESVGSLSQSPPASPLSTLPMGIPQHSRSSVFSGQSRFSSLGTDLNPLISPRSQQFSQMGSVPSSSLLTNGVISNGNGTPSSSDLIQKMKDEIAGYKLKLEKWEEGIAQARGACEAWKREAEEAKRRCHGCEHEIQILARQRDEALDQASQLRRDLEFAAAASQIPQLNNLSSNDLCGTPIEQLVALQQKLSSDLEKVQQVIAQKSPMEYGICQEPGRSSLIPSSLLMAGSSGVLSKPVLPQLN